MDGPGLHWGVWFNLETGRGVAKRERLEPEVLGIEPVTG